MSEQLTAFEPDAPARHPIHLVVTDDLQRNRLTVFFRLFLALPHLIWVAIWGIAVFFAVIAARFVGIFTGRVPDGIHDFIARWVRYATHVNAYFSLAADPFPDFGGAPGYPVDVVIAPPQKQSRLTIFFRGLLIIPHFIVLYVLFIAAFFVYVIAWFAVLFTGKWPVGLRNFAVGLQRWSTRLSAYMILLTDKYPPFGFQ